MAQRVIKIVLPIEYENLALEILESQENTSFWQEESSDTNLVISALTGVENSENIMDLFEKRFGPTEGFRLIVFPVAASLPREEKVSKQEEEQPQNNNQKNDTFLRVSREELYANIADSSKLTNVFLLLTTLSTIVAAIGLIQNSVAVIIGAMVIAPFLGPNVALAFATCLADKSLAIGALKTLVAGITITLLLTVSMGFFMEVDIRTPEILSRTSASYSDICLALASGCAGVLAFTAGIPSTLIGVMVAVALLPPLTVFGLLTGAGNYHEALGALLLLSTNIICINLAGVTTFISQGIRPNNWWEAGKAKQASRKAITTWALLLCSLIAIISYW